MRTENRKSSAAVIAGGRIDDDFALAFIRRTDPFLIAADRGLLFLERCGIEPDLLVGDFDSVPEGYLETYRAAHPGCEVRAFNWEKDDTDTEIAALAAAELGYRKIDILGATGSRLDHVLGGMQELGLLLKRGCRGTILDPCNRITLHEAPFSISRKEQWGTYVSFFAWGGEVTGLTLEGFHFPLKDFTLGNAGTLTVSNQISEAEGRVTFTSGQLLMIESRDEKREGPEYEI